MDVRQDFAAMKRAFAEISDLSSASALLHWDQETGMPAGAIDGRAMVLATLAGVIHAKATAPELRDCVARLVASGAASGLDDDETAMVRLGHRDLERTAKLDAKLVQDLAEVTSKAQAAWARARAADRFVDFAPHLERLLALKREVAERLGYVAHPLDALLDDYELGATVATLAPMFTDLARELQVLLGAIRESGVDLDPWPLLREVPIAVQREFALGVARTMGFDFERGRLDLSAHPFTQRIHAGDVRLTWQFKERDLRPGFFAVVHEAGHGLYEQGLPAHFDRTPLGEATSLGIHESQSRLWENRIARSEPFWRHFLPRLQRNAGSALNDVSVEAIVRAANRVEATFIRVEADELTYNLHIALRFEIECELFEGKLSVADVPARWNDRFEQLFGVRPPNDRAGCLQDIHWSMGAFGYFPTYALGNLYAAQLVNAADRDLGGLDALVARGELAPLRDWLRDKIHRHGRRFTAAELVRAATGAEPSAAAFVAYANAKYRKLYGLL
jgi:carboxypeptidase Taq